MRLKSESLLSRANLHYVGKRDLSKNKDAQLNDIEDLVKNLRKDMDARLIDIKGQLNVAQKKAAKTVAERPMLALGVAFVAGMALGIALARSSD
jgi:ElaB/YqjD/DUF883 family membrane-anchored ribosome-binding protein